MIVNGLLDWGVIAVLGAFSLLTIFLTQPMSNAAAAMVVLPVALEAAEKTQSNPIAFALVIMLSASISLITPFEPSCILVYGPGRYKFFDVFRTYRTDVDLFCIDHGTGADILSALTIADILQKSR